MILTERPGFGDSTRHPEGGFRDHADDLGAIIDALSLERVGILATSGGSPFALAFAERHPERVKAVTIVAGAVPLLDDEASQLIGLNAASHRLAKARDRNQLVALLTPVRDLLLADPLAGIREAMGSAPPDDRAVMSDPGWQELMFRGFREALRPGVDGWVDESLLLANGWAGVDLSAVTASVTWWHGRHDRNQPLSGVQRIVRALPNARLRIWQHAGHLGSYCHESEVLAELIGRT